MHEPPVLKRSTCPEGDTHFPAFYYSLVNSSYYSNNSKRNEDYLNQYIENNLKKPDYETEYSGKLLFFIFHKILDLGYPSLFRAMQGEKTVTDEICKVNAHSGASDQQQATARACSCGRLSAAAA